MPFTSAYYNKKMMKPKHIMIAVVFRLLAVPFAATAQVPAYLDRSADIEVRVEDALSRMTLEEKIAMVHAQSKFSSPGVPRLGIPEVWMSDGPHGVRAETLWDEWKAAGWTNDACTAFPCLECLAATWNPSLAGEYGKALGEEARYRGKTVILGPGVNIVRTPLCGRNHEYMGEEPLLAGTLAAEYIRGVQSCGVAACVKHFALNNQEARRHRYNAVVADAALHELYLPAFRTAVRDGGVWAMMGAYNKYKDEYCCHNGLLVRDILKDGWGFDGVFVSDWGGTHDTLQAVRGGLDIEFGTHTDGLSSGERNAYDDYFLARPYLELIREGTVGTEELDDKVRRVLRLVFRTTMAPDRPWGSFGSGAHSDVARDSDVADYSEGRLVGYRWLDAAGKKALYPFGYGLGYTEFRYGHVSISSAELSAHELEDGAAVDIDVEIVNAGARDGMETVQAYLSEPDAAPLRWLKACPEGRMSLDCRGAVPCKELKAFAKLRVPARGCSTARLRLDKSAFEHYSPSTGGHSITLGRYILSIARSSEDIRYTYTIHIKQ